MDHVKIRHPVRVGIIYIVEMCFYGTLISIQTLRGRKAPYTSTPAIAQLVERLTVDQLVTCVSKTLDTNQLRYLVDSNTNLNY